MTKSLRKLSLFVTVLLCFFSLIVVASCKTEFVDQGEVGKYYAFNESSEVVLSLDESGVTFKTSTLDLTGTYTFDGSALAITFAGDSSAVSVDYQNTILTFSYKGTTYKLYRNVNYTVSFYTNGAAAIAAETVQNGKAAVEPTNPTRDGYQFEGWYKDSSLSNAYDFESEVVTSDVTVYAKFAKEDPAIENYTVNFVDNVSGVAYTAEETFNGYLWTLPQASAQGKTFIGWFASDYEDGAKLTKEYTPYTVLTEDTTLYAVYEENAVAVNVTAKKVSWTSKGANKQYAVNIIDADDADADTVFTRRVTDTYVDFDFTQIPAGNYIVSVQCGDYTGKAYYCNYQLDTVCKFSVEGTKLTWNKVANATSYAITVVCDNAAHEHTNLDLGNVNEYDFAACTMGEKGISFTVTANAENYISSTSKAYTVSRMLGEVKNIQFANNALTWDAVEGATAYKVAITSDGKTTSKVVDTTSLVIDTYYGELDVQVTPVAAAYYAKATDYKFNKTVLATPQNIKFVGFNVSWDAVKDAKSYIVTIGGKEFTATTNELTLTETQCEEITKFEINVKAVASDAANNSLVSETVTLDKTGITSATYANGKVTWTAVPGVTKYAVKVDDGEVAIVERATEYAVAITSGEHTISVAITDSDGKYNENDFFSQKITVYALTFDTQGGDEVATQYYVLNDTLLELPTPTYAGYTFAGWYSSIGGDVFTATTFAKAEDMTIYAEWTANKYTITLDYATYGTGDIASKEVAFGSSFDLPVPTTTDGLKAFAGWYSDINGVGERYTDENGASLKKFRDYNDVTLYAGWLDIFSFNEIDDGKAYSVSKGPAISFVSTITIPTTYLDKPVTTVEASAFASCTSLVVINIPQTIQNIEVGANGPTGTGNCFQSCSKLEAVNIYTVEGTKAEDIKYESIEGVLIYHNEYNGVEIKYFPYYTKGGTYTIPSIVTTIPTNAFKSCSKLEEIIIPASVTKIDESAFYLCSKLTKITFLPAEDGQTESELVLGAKVFQSCTTLKEITLPARMTNFTTDIFTSCSALEKVNISGTYEGAKYASVEGVLTNAEKTTIVFYPRGRVEEYTTPVGIDTIGELAFNAAKLTAINISGQVKLIEKEAFKACTSLNKITFLGDADSTPLTISQSAFYGCTSTELVEVTLPENLVKMEVNAFGGCTHLTKVTVKAVSDKIDFAADAFGSTATTPLFYVTDLTLSKDVHAFNITGVFGALKLVNVIVEDGNENYTSIEGVLYDKAVTKIVYYPTEREGNYSLPETIVEIGNRVFQSNTGITSIVINKNVTTIGEGAFQSCTKLESITFEEGGTAPLTIGKQAFYSCSALTSITLPERLVSIGDKAFYQCKLVKEIKVPSTCKTIGDYAFQYCYALEKVELPLGLETIVETNSTSSTDAGERIRIFDNCTALKEIYIPDGNPNYKTIDGVLYKVIYNEDKTVKGLELNTFPAGRGGDFVVPAEVISVASHAFYYSQSVESVSFAERTGEMTFGAYVFYYCKALKNLSLPSGLKNLDAYTVYYCDLIESIEIPNTVETIVSKAIYYCHALKSVTFEEGGTAPLRLEDGTLYSEEYSTIIYGFISYCPLVTSITIPERTVYIGKYNFAALTMDSIIIPSSVTEIASYAFYKSNISTISFAEPSQVATIGTYAFAYNTRLEGIKLPDGLTAISNDLFYGCSSLTTVFIPASVKSIGSYAFYGLTNLTNVIFDEGSQLEDIQYYAFKNSGITSFTFPQSIKNIGYSAFENCTKLEEITFEEEALVDGVMTKVGSSLETIGKQAFKGTAITSFTFPYCGKDAAGQYRHITLGAITTSSTTVRLFESCKNLETIYVSEAVTSIEDLFTKCSSIKKIVIAEDSQNFRVSDESPVILNSTGSTIYLIFVRSEGEFVIPSNVTSIGSYAFSGQTDIKKIIIPRSVKSIDDYAFYNCVNLETVEFENGSVCDTIGTYAFANCYSLKSINLPDVTSISDYTFLWDVSLENVTIPTSVTEIGKYAFGNCMGLKTIDIPASVEKIYDYAFYRCSSLTDVVLKDGLTYFGNYLFSTCENLTSVSLPGSVKTYGYYTFYNCANLTNVTLNEGFLVITNNMFNGCEKLETLVLPSTIYQIGTTPFKGTAIKSLVIPAAVKYLASFSSSAPTATASSGAFQDATCLESVVFEEGSKLTIMGTSAFKNTTALKTVVLPEGIKYITSNAFEGSGIESITIPASVVGICAGSTSATYKPTETTASTAFKNCVNLSEVNFASGTALKYIGVNTFEGCTALKTITLPDSLAVLGNNAFLNSGLESFKVPTGITTLGSATSTGSVFKGCTALTTIDFNKVTTINGYAFSGCTSLKELTLPTTVKVIGSYAFQNSGLEKIVISLKTCTINTYAFDGCTALSDVTLPASLTTLGNYAFRGCTALKTITLPTTLTTIGSYTFQNSGLTEIEIPSKCVKLSTSATTSSYTFAGCTDLTKVTFKGNVTIIGTNMFNGCTSLTDINFPTTITGIGANAFYNTGLTAVKLGKAVTTIGAAAFNACPNMTSFEIDSANTTYMAYDNKAIIKKSDASLISVFGNVTGNFEIPETVKAFGSYAFQGVKGIDTLTLPAISAIPSYAFKESDIQNIIINDATTSIALYAFQNSKVKTVTLGKGTTTLAGGVFDGCANLEKVYNSEVITSYGYYSFRNCTSLTEFTLGDNVTTLSYNIFYGSGLTKIDIPASIKTIGASATSSSEFYNCTNLTEVTLHEGLEVIGTYAFYNTGITTINIPSTVTTIGTYAFKGTKLSTVTIPENVTSVGTGAFQACTELVSAKVESSNLGTYTFDACDKLETVEVTGAITEVPTYCFDKCPLLKSVTLPNSVTIINTHAFEADTALEEIALPQSLETIQTNAFASSGLKKVVLPDSVINVFENAYQNCTELEEVVLNEGLETLGVVATLPTAKYNGSVFMGCTKLAKINIPTTLVSIGSQTFDGCTALKEIYIPANVSYVGNRVFQGWTADQVVNIEASRYEITGQWFEVNAVSDADGFCGYWAGSDAKFVYEYVQK